MSLGKALQLATRIDKRHHQPTSQKIIGENGNKYRNWQHTSVRLQRQPNERRTEMATLETILRVFPRSKRPIKGFSKTSTAPTLCRARCPRHFGHPDRHRTCTGGRHRICESHEFRQAKQDESETADQFVMKLF